MTAAHFSRTLFRSAVVALFMLGCSAGALVGTLYAWHVAREYLRLRSMCLAASIGTALIATLFMAIAMRELDRPMAGHVPAWYVRGALKVNKRIILVGELVAMGLALASAFLLAFDFKIPAI